jgi:hypothetical protein
MNGAEHGAVKVQFALGDALRDARTQILGDGDEGPEDDEPAAA